MTDKVWYAAGLTAERNDSLTNGDAPNGDLDLSTSDVRCVNQVPITSRQRPWVAPKNSPLKNPGGLPERPWRPCPPS